MPSPGTADERELLSGLTRRLTTALPPTWGFSGDIGARLGLFSGTPDAVLTVQAPDGRSARIGVEIRQTFYPRDVYTVSAQLGGLLPTSTRSGRPSLQAGVAGWLVLSQYLTPRTREMLAAAGFSYADASGNIRLEVPSPPLYIELQGAGSNPKSSDQPLQSLRGGGSSRVVRALVDFTPPYTLRDLASRADLPLSTTSRVVSYLVDEALLTRDGRGPIAAVDWAGVIRRWAEDYSLLTSNRSTVLLDPRGPIALAQRLPMLSGRWAATGALAVPAEAAVATPALAAVYVDDIDEAAAQLGLTAVAGAGNVVLLEPQSDVAFERLRNAGGLTSVALSQVAVDLLTSPGRGPVEGEALLAWMGDNENEWRRS